MRMLIAAVLALGCAAARADVVALDGWARATVPGQNVGGVFLTLQSSAGAVLTGARCECASLVQIHETVEQNGVASMRERKDVPLPAGQTVQFRPGSLHIMLFGLKAPLKAGQTVDLQLQVREQGKVRQVPLKVMVRDMGAMNGGAGHDMHHGHHGHHE